ncbi:unnamed protein product [Colias eurytheme]|nr:unnamed protein product [Colias eurytheme]
MFRAYRRIGFACAYCDKEYPDPADLKKHSLESHEGIEDAFFAGIRDLSRFTLKLDITSLRCTICNSDIDTLDRLVEHLVNAHGKTLHTDIKNQIVPFKFNSGVLSCYICLNRFNRFKPLFEHMSSHVRNYVCDNCDSAFITRRRLSAHARNHKLGVFECNLCQKVFDTLVKKQSHVRTVHTKKIVYRCGSCNLVFVSYRAKERHVVEEHGHATLKCEPCDKTFMHQRAYWVHMKRDHLMERKFSCEACGKKFFTSRTLKDHSVTHTRLKNYQCDVCLKSYGRQDTLRLHLRIHANDRRFKCQYCEQAFVQKSTWKSHVKSKHGEVV